MSAEQALATYRELLAKVDQKFADILAAHTASFVCARGCHSCCKPGLSVGAVEAANLRDHLERHPEVAAKLVALATADPHHGSRCSLLDADGLCSVYKARPIICRSHGAPVAFTLVTGGPVERDVCPLNFANEPLPAMSAGHHINLDVLNTILALLNQQANPGGARVRLTVDSLLKS